MAEANMLVDVWFRSLSVTIGLDLSELLVRARKVCDTVFCTDEE